MKKHQLAIVGVAFFSATALFTSCKKNDLAYQKPADQTVAAVASKTQPEINNNWASASWRPNQHEKFTTFQSKVSDSSITASVISKGLVLVYQKSGSKIETLPFDEAGTKRFWNYEVSKGGVTINCDVYEGSQAPDASASFKTIVLSAEQLAQLEAKGQSKASLMNGSFEQVAALLNH